MRLVGEPAGAGDVTQGFLGGEHERLGAPNAAAYQEGVWGLAHGDLEGAAKVAGAEAHDRSQAVQHDGVAKALLDIVAYALQLPGRETAPRDGAGIGFDGKRGDEKILDRPRLAVAKHQRQSIQIAARCVRIMFDGTARVIDQFGGVGRPKSACASTGRLLASRVAKQHGGSVSRWRESDNP